MTDTPKPATPLECVKWKITAAIKGKLTPIGSTGIVFGLGYEECESVGVRVGGSRSGNNYTIEQAKQLAEKINLDVDEYYATHWADDDTPLFECAPGIRGRKPATQPDGLLERAFLARCASCECNTKTPEIKYHDPLCRYRVLAELTAEVERLRKIDAALVKYRRKEREILNLPEDAREEDHLERMRHIIRQHKEVDAAYAVASDGKAFWKAECDKLKAALAKCVEATEDYARFPYYAKWVKLTAALTEAKELLKGDKYGG